MLFDVLRHSTLFVFAPEMFAAVKPDHFTTPDSFRSTTVF
jgi:hypothetical protein